MHEVEMGLGEYHVIVHGLDFNPMRPQSANHRIDLSGKQNKISRNCSSTLTRGLEVDAVAVPIAGGTSMPYRKSSLRAERKAAGSLRLLCRNN